MGFEIDGGSYKTSQGLTFVITLGWVGSNITFMGRVIQLHRELRTYFLNDFFSRYLKLVKYKPFLVVFYFIFYIVHVNFWGK